MGFWCSCNDHCYQFVYEHPVHCWKCKRSGVCESAEAYFSVIGQWTWLQSTSLDITSQNRHTISPRADYWAFPILILLGHREVRFSSNLPAVGITGVGLGPSSGGVIRSMVCTSHFSTFNCICWIFVLIGRQLIGRSSSRSHSQNASSSNYITFYF
jgi:hypothetical protein